MSTDGFMVHEDMIEDVKNGIIIHNFQESHGEKIHALAVADFWKLN